MLLRSSIVKESNVLSIDLLGGKRVHVPVRSGTVSSPTMAAARKQACNMKTMFAMLRQKQQSGRKTNAMMVMPDGTVMRM